MASKTQFSCFIIGEDALLLECGDILLARGHEVRGVITASSRVMEWAEERILPVIDSTGDYAFELGQKPFDYLFAVTHLQIIPDRVLALPERGAINFHDGPLPRYAGLHAPAWALLARESHYGITWHAITRTLGVDQGDILKQVTFDIGPGETSLSLNTKCFAHAIESFGELLSELAAGSEVRTPQDLTGRTYFAKRRRPPAACVLDWSQSALLLEAMVRATDFGERHENRFGAAKVVASGKAWVVKSAEARPLASPASPGTVVGVHAQAIEVATGDGSLWLTELASLGGQKVAPSECARVLGIEVGGTFDVLPDDQRLRLTELDRNLARTEDFWLGRLTATEPALPHDVIPLAGDPARVRGQRRELVLDLGVVEKAFDGDIDRVESLIVVFAIHHARTTDKEQFSLGLTTRALLDQVAELPHLVASVVPLSVKVEWNLGFQAMRERLARELGEISSRATFAQDLVARCPSLWGRPGLADGSGFPVLIAVDAPAHPDSRLALLLSTEGDRAVLSYDPRFLTDETAQRLGKELTTLLAFAVAHPHESLAKLPMLSDDERARMLVDWNRTAHPAAHACIHHLIEEQSARTPDATALVFGEIEVSYRSLNERANQLACHLRTLSVGPDVLVGIHLGRSIELVVAALAVMKAGGGYVPLDPDYPKERIAFMLEDAKLMVVISDQRHAAELASTGARVVRLDDVPTDVASYPRTNLEGGAEPKHLAYVIYTSGSTGTPKGVMVEHKSVVNFFAGMDERIPHDPPGTWLSVTSLSFDISVLELFYTLSRGFRVVIHSDRERATSSRVRSHKAGELAFSLFYFASDEGEEGLRGHDPSAPASAQSVGQKAAGKYDLLLQGAKFADQHGFSAVWTPERHFHAFGGLYPNPAVTAAALAVTTERLQIRAGSVVLPLHHPIRVAESWAVVDNLSNGRVGVSFASGWQPNDFVLRPEAFKDAKNIMFRDVEVVRALWRGEAVPFPGPRGEAVEVRTLPRPVQKELPVWITTAGNIDTYKMAGEIGANILTHLLGQTIEQLAPKIQAYRTARREHGHDPDGGTVSLMLHTFVGEDASDVREIVRGPLKRYLGSSLELLKQYAWAFPAFTRTAGQADEKGDELSQLSADEREAMLEHAFARYYESSGLFGPVEGCLARVRELVQIGVTDIACLIDFGIPSAMVLQHLADLATLRERACAVSKGELVSPNAPSPGASIGAEIERYGVTHLQCTPSMARLLLDDRETEAQLARLACVMLGGEALPLDIAGTLTSATRAKLLNMYGPTETTVWSTTAEVERAAAITIGRPIANTRVYVLDARREPVSIGTLGELYIAGEGVARGYLYRDDLTAQRFVADPFTKGGRMYRTGDMARWLPDGSLAFAGRRDEQVKVRGHRVELREVEAVLARAPEVQECAVILREDVPGDQRLVAYVVPRQGKFDGRALRDLLRQRLPEFMVPSHVVSLARLPHTPNRKIDRQALPRPQAAAEATSPTASALPESATERTVAGLWQEILGREHIGVDDNFFDVGGHSLLIVKMHRKLCELLARPILLTDLYRYPTIRSLSRFLANDANESGDREHANAAGGERASLRREMMERRRTRVVE